MEQFIKFKKVWFVTPILQIILLVALFIIIAILGKISVVQTGLLFDRPVSFYIETLFAPVYEEIIFRGVIFATLLKYKPPVKAIIYSSLLFGLWHLKNIFFIDAVQLVKQICYTALFFGPLMAFVTYKTKTIWIPVILHYINNAFAFFMINQAMVH